MTPQQRTAYANFCAAIAPYDIYLGATKQNKQAVFCELYDPHSDTVLNLIVTNHHPELHLVPRPGYDQSIMERQTIDDATDEVMKRIAVKAFRDAPGDLTMDNIVGMMVRAMRTVFDDPKSVETEITRIVQAR